MKRRRGGPLVPLAALLLAAAVWLVGGWYVSGPLDKDTRFTVPEGATLAMVAAKLESEHAVSSAMRFRLRARMLSGGSAAKAGEFLLPRRASEATIMAILSGTEVVRRAITIPEGMPSILVYERLMANPQLTGRIAVPAEGSVMPDTYEIRLGEPRQDVLDRMQAAMKATLAELWAGRAKGLPVATPQQALILAAIVEKETGKPAERAVVAGLYENRLRQGMMLQADPTIIYPITKGKPLGRRIRQSEIQATNDYNTYTMTGLPKGPITNPGRASIAAVLNPAKTSALYMVADGSGGHAFADTLEQHNANVQKWFALRRARGEM